MHAISREFPIHTTLFQPTVQEKDRHNRQQGEQEESICMPNPTALFLDYGNDDRLHLELPHPHRVLSNRDHNPSPIVIEMCGDPKRRSLRLL